MFAFFLHKNKLFFNISQNTKKIQFPFDCEITKNKQIFSLFRFFRYFEMAKFIVSGDEEKKHDLKVNCLQWERVDANYFHTFYCWSILSCINILMSVIFFGKFFSKIKITIQQFFLIKKWIFYLFHNFTTKKTYSIVFSRFKKHHPLRGLKKWNAANWMRECRRVKLGKIWYLSYWFIFYIHFFHIHRPEFFLR